MQIGSRSPGPHPTTVLLRLSVLLSAVAGFGLGMALLGSIALGSAAALPFAALAQAHGQVQALGFVGLFVLGAGGQLLPGFLSTPLTRRGELTLGGYLVATGLLARVIAQPLPVGLTRDLGLALSAVGETVGVALCLFSFAGLLRRSIQPPELWRRLALAGFALLVACLALNLVAVGTLLAGAAVVPEPLDLALVELELWGFATYVAFGVARKLLPRFLLLPSPDDRRLVAGAIVYGLGLVLVILALLLATRPSPLAAGLMLAGALLQLLGAALFLDGLRLYRAPIRASGAPNVTEPARRWMRIAFGWLVVAAALTGFATLPGLATGTLPPYFALGAARHALGQGFLLTLIVSLGSRILPGYSAWAIARPRLLEGLVGAITVGGVVRVAGELGLAFAWPGSGPLAAAGGAIAVLAFLVFAAALFATVGQIPAARPPAPRRTRPPSIPRGGQSRR